jgi:hypothetical protein
MPRRARRVLYNRGFFAVIPRAYTKMQAEELNAVARRLQDLSQRNAELRRYL